MFTEFDSYLFHEGTLYDSYEKLGAHPCVEDGVSGVRFAVWAQKARSVAVAIFDAFNGDYTVPMAKTQPGIWEVFVPEVQKGTCYKYKIEGADGTVNLKADPWAFYSELRPANGSIVWGLEDYPWTDGDYMHNLRHKFDFVDYSTLCLKDLPAETADKVMEIQTREADAVFENSLNDAKWFASEKIEAAKKVWEKKCKAEPDKIILPEGMPVPDIEDTADEKTGEAGDKADIASEKDILAEKIKEFWEEETEKAVAAAQEGIVRRDPVPFDELSGEEKRAYLNRSCAEMTWERPMSIYEVHLGSWKKDYRLNKDGFLNYRGLADQLAEYVDFMGFTHVELMGICEYPFDGSWGYQVTGYFSPTSRHGRPEDLKYLIDKMHSRGIGVIIDWVPAHFPKDAFGLVRFDGSPSFESPDPLLAEYPEWGTVAFDHSRPEVRSFRISSAFYWIREFHADALRVDAVAAMIYTNFSRAEWRPNKYGGSLNLDSIAFMKQLNKEVVDRLGAFLIAEDSSAEQGITRQVYEGGMGFMYKWNMGWMNDTLNYFKKDPIYRKFHFHEITHTMDYVFSEYFVNVLSHDEVVHLKKPMIYKIPGTMPDKLSGLKTLYTYQFTHPGKKLLFMGSEFAEDHEWNEDKCLNWGFVNDTWHRDVMLCVQSLNRLYRENEVLYNDLKDDRRVQWVNNADYKRGILAYIRKKPESYDGALLVILNTTPVQYDGYSCGIPVGGFHQRIFSTYDSTPGTGDDSSKIPPITAVQDMCDGFDYRITYDLRPNEAVVIRV